MNSDKCIHGFKIIYCVAFINSLLFITEYRNLFMYSLPDVRLGCFQLGLTINNASTDILIQIYLGYMLELFWWGHKYLGVKLVG